MGRVCAHVAECSLIPVYAVRCEQITSFQTSKGLLGCPVHLRPAVAMWVSLTSRHRGERDGAPRLQSLSAVIGGRVQSPRLVGLLPVVRSWGGQHDFVSGCVFS